MKIELRNVDRETGYLKTIFYSSGIFCFQDEEDDYEWSFNYEQSRRTYTDRHYWSVEYLQDQINWGRMI